MRNLKAAIKIIKEFEGLYLKAYLDPVKIPTIGWGSIYHPDGRPVKMGDEITSAQAEAYLLHEVKEKALAVEKALTKPATDNQFCAMLSLAYNIGATGFKKSLVCKRFNEGNVLKAGEAFLIYNKAKGKILKGLTRRRVMEQKLFLTNITEEKETMSIVPKSKPMLNIVEIQKILEANKIDRKKYPVCLINIRGYYLDSMGAKGKNDRGIYDDAFFWISTNGMMSFNGNSDPSKYRKGKGKGSEKGMAELICGVWLYQTGIHNGSSPHPAFRQADKVTVKRDGLDKDYLDTGWFGINIHRGGANGTSSLGCQTIPTAQWSAFKELGYSELKRNGQKVFPYILIDETQRRKGNLIAGSVV